MIQVSTPEERAEQALQLQEEGGRELRFIYTIASYTDAFAVLEGAPVVDSEGFMNMPQGPGSINRL